MPVRQQKTFLNKIIGVLVILSVFLVGAVFVVMGNDPKIYGEQKRDLIPPYQIKCPATIEFEDGTTMQKRVPFEFKTDQSFNIVLDLSDVGMIDGKTLSFIGQDMPMRCEVDGEVIFRQIPCLSDSDFDDANMLYFIQLPDEIEKNQVILRFENYDHYKSVYEIQKMKIGNRISLVVDYTKQDFFGIIVIILVSFLFAAYVLSTNFLKKLCEMERYFGYNILLSLLIGTYIMSNLSTSYFIFHKYNLFLDLIQYTSIMIAPVCLLKAISYRVDESFKPLLSTCTIIALINLIMQYALTILEVSNLALLVKVTHIIILITAIVALYAVVKTKDDGNNRINYTKASLTPLALSQVIEVIEVLMNKQGISTAYLICIITFAILCFVEIFAYYRSYRDQQIKTTMYQTLAYTDQLTSLGNRLAYSKQISVVQEEKKDCYVVLMDIDGLKYVNDTYGHKYGDAIIKLLGNMLEGFNEGHSKDLYRIGGDEFVMLYYGESVRQFELELNEVAQAYREAKVLDGVDSFGVSYGYCYYDSKGDKSAEECVHIADQSMYAQKQKKKIVRGEWNEQTSK